MKKSQKPELRFPGFTDEWKSYKLGSFSDIKSGYTFPPKYQGKKNEKWLYVKVADIGNRDVIKYLRTTINSVSSEIMHELNAKPFRAGCTVFPRVGAALLNNNKRLLHRDSLIDDNVLAVNIIDLKKCDDEFFFYWFLTKHLSKFCNNGQVPVISARRVKAYSVPIPSIVEQKKIAQFLTTIDTRLQQLTQKVALLEDYKKGVLQQLFSRRIRFRDEQGEAFPEWEKVKLSEVLHEHGAKSEGNEEVFSVSVHKGLVNQIEHLGRSFAAKTTDHYNLVKPHDIVYTKSPTGDFPYGIIKQSRVSENVIVSPLYGVFTPETPALGYILNDYFASSVNTHNYLHSIIQKGAKNTINITNKTFLSKSLKLPRDKEEQQKIADFLKVIDCKIELAQQQVDKTQQYKKALLQKMFV